MCPWQKYRQISRTLINNSIGFFPWNRCNLNIFSSCAQLASLLSQMNFNWVYLCTCNQFVTFSINFTKYFSRRIKSIYFPHLFLGSVIGFCVCFLVCCRMKTQKKRGRKRNTASDVGDGDYLVNGMYLWKFKFEMKCYISTICISNTRFSD